MNDTTCYHIEKVSNGYIVSETHSFREGVSIRGPQSFAVRPPHVFETYEAMQKWLRVRFEGEPDQGAESQ